jgi:RecA-family ATPase
MDEAVKNEEGVLEEKQWLEDELDKVEYEQSLREWARSFSPKTDVDELLLEGVDREEAYFAMRDELSDYLIER